MWFLFENSARPAPETSKPEGASPPRFTHLLRDIETHEGERVQFDCKVLGNPPPMVKWFRGRQEIQSSLDFQVIRTTLQAVYTCL